MTYEDVKRQRAEKEKRSVSPSELRVFRLTLMGVAGCQQRSAKKQQNLGFKLETHDLMMFFFFLVLHAKRLLWSLEISYPHVSH